MLGLLHHYVYFLTSLYANYSLIFFYFPFHFSTLINCILHLIQTIQYHILNQIPSSKRWSLDFIIQKCHMNFLLVQRTNNIMSRPTIKHQSHNGQVSIFQNTPVFFTPLKYLSSTETCLINSYVNTTFKKEKILYQTFFKQSFRYIICSTSPPFQLLPQFISASHPKGNSHRLWCCC